MDPGYETVLDASELIWTMVGYLVHGAFMALHVAFASYLLASGALTLFAPGREGPWLERLGLSFPTPPRRGLAGLRMILGLLLLTPVALGAAMGVSLVGGVAGLALLIVAERGGSPADRAKGRLARSTVIASGAAACLFMVWEGEDNLALGSELIFHMSEWRNEELGWQLSLDPRSPKVGDLAPDFELQDPEGRVKVRLSDFRGKRPVALIFGSYT